jgi:hypothetical protein
MWWRLLAEIQQKAQDIDVQPDASAGFPLFPQHLETGNEKDLL